MLQTDGWITREHGLGSYVKSRLADGKGRMRLGRAGTGTTRGHAGLQPHPRRAGRCPSPHRALLGTDDERAVLRQWTTAYDERPNELVSCWFPPEIANGTDLGKTAPLVDGIRQHLRRSSARASIASTSGCPHVWPTRANWRSCGSQRARRCWRSPRPCTTPSDVLLLVVAIVLPGDLHELEDSYAVAD